jgi:hypothetical protein
MRREMENKKFEEEKSIYLAGLENPEFPKNEDERRKLQFDQGNTYMKELPDLIKKAREERRRKLLDE